MQMGGWMDGWMDRQTDRQTDAIKLINTFSNFVNAPKRPQKGKWRMASWKTQEQV